MPAFPMDRRNGIPILGFGTYPLRGRDVQAALATALDLGIRHIDTAQMYGNEADIGELIRSSAMVRSELYVVTKVAPENLSEARFASSVARSIDDLGGPVDLLLIHWPPAVEDLEATIERLVAEQRKGTTKAIGVSNFPCGMLRRAHNFSGGAIVCNQVEFHPLLDQKKLHATARDLNVALSAYSPLARGKALKPEVVQKVAGRIGRPPSEVVLRWIIQQGVIAIPMTTNRANAQSNLRALDFELTDADMALLSTLGTPQGRTISPSWMTIPWED